MKAVGSECHLYLYKGQEHGFFNYCENQDPKYFIETMFKADVFLRKQGIIKGKPTIKDLSFLSKKN
ncbi:hypothetical protein ADIARSV_3249 [Arcticibacter svalbardensis MN12-7]|uniref:Uncharacterized protein n=1 Tax=Arcticibacter svalbardensis MN12-7 TaxID=1150600 RepID=R9GP92_9SPHI|nr:hypothetical protein [Arcticibacter svalbardensis]EOR93536.1 hypothetical protein ADIARSV_3249 [Arcticibacter svalbardensis MN12-7]